MSGPGKKRKRVSEEDGSLDREEIDKELMPPPSSTTEHRATYNPNDNVIPPHKWIIIQPGSAYLRIGLGSVELSQLSTNTTTTTTTPSSTSSSTSTPSTEKPPQIYTIPNIIARQSKIKSKNYNLPSRNAADEKAFEEVREAAVATIEQERVPASKKSKEPAPRPAPKPMELAEDMPEQQRDDFRWLDISTFPNVIVGDDAERIPGGSRYEIFQPFNQGKFNISENYPIRAVLNDIYCIWAYAFREKLGIKNFKDLDNYGAFLLLNDGYSRKEVRELIHLIFREFGFKSLSVHVESAAAAIYSGLPLATVVDLGDQKISICCLDEGIPINQSRVILNYGGRDISRALLWLLQKPKGEQSIFAKFSLDEPQHRNIINQIKQSSCHLRSVIDTDWCEYKLREKGKPTKKCRVSVSDPLALAPRGLFYPQLFEPREISRQDNNQYDAEEPFDDAFLADVISSKSSKTDQAENPKSEGENTDDPAVPVKKDELMGLDEAIIASIEKAGRKDIVRKFYTAILLVGGSSQIPGLEDLLKFRIADKIQNTMVNMEVDVVHNRREIDRSLVAWKGAAVMSCLETEKDYTITRAEWESCGLRLLKERVPFYF